jgi:hypothetical protein
VSRQTIMVFTCRGNDLADTTMRYAGGFEIVSAPHAHLPGPGGMVSVILVIHGTEDALRDHEAKTKEFLGVT